MVVTVSEMWSCSVAVCLLFTLQSATPTPTHVDTPDSTRFRGTYAWHFMSNLARSFHVPDFSFTKPRPAELPISIKIPTFNASKIARREKKSWREKPAALPSRWSRDARFCTWLNVWIYTGICGHCDNTPKRSAESFEKCGRNSSAVNALVLVRVRPPCVFQFYR